MGTRSKGGVEILRHGVTHFYEEGFAKVHKGDIFRTVDPPGGEGTGLWCVADADPERIEHTRRDGTKCGAWKIKSHFAEF